jgi:hypothetical protein
MVNAAVVTRHIFLFAYMPVKETYPPFGMAFTPPAVHRPWEGVRSTVVHPTEEGTSIVRIRFALALVVAGLLCAVGIASAQTPTDTTTNGYTSTVPTTPAGTTTSGYTAPTPTVTNEGTPTATTQGQTQTGVAPTVAAQPAGSAPSSLAFTGAEPLLLILAGLGLAGGTAALLVRDRRRSQDR